MSEETKRSPFAAWWRYFLTDKEADKRAIRRDPQARASHPFEDDSRRAEKLAADLLEMLQRLENAKAERAHAHRRAGVSESEVIGNNFDLAEVTIRAYVDVLMKTTEAFKAKRYGYDAVAHDTFASRRGDELDELG